MSKKRGVALPGARLSAPAYFGCVLLATALGVWVTAQFRPSLAHSIQDLFGVENKVKATPDSFYAVRVEPLFVEHCAGCHGERRQKGKLRLDNFGELMRGGRSGPAVKPGDAEHSELFSRLLLPPTDEKAMPPEGKAPIKGDDLTVIKLWIAAGASGTLAANAVKGAPPPVKKIKFEEIDPAQVEQKRAKLAAAVKQLQARFPGVIAYESRGSADLEVNASLLGQKFGDADLAALAPLGENIVRVDVSGTAIGDEAAKILAGMTRLRALRLMNTKVTDAAAQTLSAAQALKSLTVVGTAVTEPALQPLRQRGVTVYSDESDEESDRGKS